MKTSAYVYDEGDADDVSHARNGSVVAKLFGKNQPQVAVDSPNGHEDAEEVSDNASEDESEGNHGHDLSNGNGEGILDEDDDEDDEYVPESDSDDSNESDVDDGTDDGDEDGEGMSMRSLLMPMARHAKQLLFLGEDDDDGEFDDQDAELWSSPQEKHEWISRYEAMNRAYIDQYGCRIDAPANPELKKRLRRERNREAKYSLVLLALAIAYLIRLLVGPAAVPSHKPAIVNVAPSPAPIAESVDVLLDPGASRTKPSSDPTWWTVWTEELVVHAMSWPGSLITKLQSSSALTDALVGGTSEDTPTGNVKPIPVPTPSSKSIIDDTIPPAHPLEKIEIVKAKEDVANPAAVEDSTSTTTNDHLAPHAEESSSEAHVQAGAVQFSPIPSVRDATDVQDENPRVKDEPDISSYGAPQPLDAVAEPSGSDFDPKMDLPGETLPEEHLDGKDLNQQDDAATDSYQRCLDKFHILVKTKRDAGVKAEALVECDQAVHDAQDPSTLEWVHAHLLRGDLRSLIQSFEGAQTDYEEALSSDALKEMTTLLTEIEVKVASNRWIKFYHLKKFKDLRADCQRIHDGHSSSASSAYPDRVSELALDWLRAFRKEIRLLDVLTKTRAWTLYRPNLQQTQDT